MVVSKKICFVIAPIGEKGSETKDRSDKVLKYIIRPSVEECGYKAIRADEISKPGIITTQIIQHLVEDDLVIADLTERNPNVFYELAIRHAVKKPIVQIIKDGEEIPFDVATTRTIPLDHQDLESAIECKETLIKQIHSVEEDPERVDNPITTAIDLRALRQSRNPLEKSTVEIMLMLQDIRVALQNIGKKPSDIGLSRNVSLSVVEFIRKVNGLIQLKEIPEDIREKYKEYLKNLIAIVEAKGSESDLRFLGRNSLSIYTLPLTFYGRKKKSKT
jgi:hypothetical protein